MDLADILMADAINEEVNEEMREKRKTYQYADKGKGVLKDEDGIPSHLEE